MKSFNKLFFFAAILSAVSCSGLSNIDSESDVESSATKRITAICPISIDLTGAKALGISEANSVGTKSNEADGGCLSVINSSGDNVPAIIQYEISAEDMSEEELLQESSAASRSIKISPSLISDLGEYVLLSGCTMSVDESIASEAILDMFDKTNIRTSDLTYMLREKDGAIFDLTGHDYFTYGLDAMSIVTDFNWKRDKLVLSYHYQSPNGMLYFADFNIGFRRMVDKGDFLEFETITKSEASWPTYVLIDKDENLYLANYPHSFGVFMREGGYKVAENPSVEYGDSYNDRNTSLQASCTDENGEMYGIFMGYREIVIGHISDGNIKKLSSIQRIFNNTISDKINLYEGTMLGLHDGNIAFTCWNFPDESFNWNALECHLYCYNINSSTWTDEPISKDIMDELHMLYKYDAYILSGIRLYGMKMNGGKLIVTEIDMYNQTVAKNEMDVQLPEILQPTYSAEVISNNVYFSIIGRSPEDGARVVCSIDINTGLAISHKWPDSRETISFSRIN